MKNLIKSVFLMAITFLILIACLCTWDKVSNTHTDDNWVITVFVICALGYILLSYKEDNK